MLHKQMDLGFDSQHSEKNLGAVVHICNPSRGVVGTGCSLRPASLTELANSRFSKILCLKINENN